MHEPPPAEPFPLEALGPLKDAADAIHDKTQAPAAIAAQAVLSVVALAVQGLADVETLGGKAPCSIFLLTVAVSGERKSTCDNLAMRAVRDFEEELAAARTSEVTVAKNRRAIWEANRRRILGEKADDKTKKAAREADLHALGTEPEAPLAHCDDGRSYGGRAHKEHGAAPALPGHLLRRGWSIPGRFWHERGEPSKDRGGAVQLLGWVAGHEAPRRWRWLGLP